MHFTSILAGVAFARLALTAPSNGALDKRTQVDECKLVNVVISVYSQYGAAATSFCSSYISIPEKTVSSITTTTSTTTVTYSPTATAAEKRSAHDLEERSQSLPPFVSSFKAGQLSTACSCLSIPQATTTVKSTSTVATTVTQCASSLPTFILQLENSGIVLKGKALDGTYDNLDTGDGELIGFNGASEANALVLSLNAAGNLIIDSTGEIGYMNEAPEDDPPLLMFEAPNNIISTPATFYIAGGVLMPYGLGKTLQLCPGRAVTNDLFLGSGVATGCVNPTLRVINVCVPKS